MTTSVSPIVLFVAIVVSLFVGGWSRDALQRNEVRVNLEEGFRTFIEHHTDIDRDSDEADRRWEQSVKKRKQEQFSRQFLNRRQ